MPFPVHVRSIAPGLLRALLTAMVALAIAGAPSFVALGIGEDVREPAEPGAVGILPFAADPGHRMSPGSAAQGLAAAGAATALLRWSVLLGPALPAAEAAAGLAPHAWLRRILTGVRLQSDGG